LILQTGLLDVGLGLFGDRIAKSSSQ